MAILPTKSLTNILLVEGGGVCVLAWEKGALTLLARYRPINPDFEAFQVFLRSQLKTPFVIITDFIEEDFRNESVAHVTGSDRTALLTRKLNHTFRTTQYRTARVVGREKEGRKDDKVLFTALTKPELLDPWISRILELKIPIKALTSAAYLMELFALTLKFKQQPHLLLVSQEHVSGLRQTYLQNGRVIFSRLTAIKDAETASFEQMLLEQCEQTRKYLERIKQLPYDALLNVHVYTQVPMTDARERQQELLRFTYVAISEMESKAQIDLQGVAPGAIAFTLSRVLAGKGVPNVYAPLQTRRFLYLDRISRALIVLGGMVLVTGVAASAPAVFEVTSSWERERELVAQTQPLLQEYEILRERFPETPIPSSQMELVVGTHEGILAQAFNPLDTLSLISQALEASPELDLAKIEWELVEVPPEEGAAVFGDGLVESADVVYQKAVVARRTTLVIYIEGRVQSTQSHREAQAQVLAFTQALEAFQGIQVTPVTMPMDAGSNGFVTTTLDGELVRADFLLELRRVSEP
jgi:hypothetical protein